MGFRITTNGLFRSYNASLQRSGKNLSDAMRKVETHRKFTTYAEDPAAASQAFQRRRALWRTEDQITNSNYVISKFQTGWDAIQKICDGNDNQPGLSGIGESLGIIDDSQGGGRHALGNSLLTVADAVVQGMNCQFGDTFVFAGDDGMNVPFSWGGDDTLLYRGIDVSNRLLVFDKNNVLTDKMVNIDANGTLSLKTQDNFQMENPDGSGTMVDDQDAYIEYLEEVTDLDKTQDDFTDTVQQPVLDENGDPVLDGGGNQVMEEVKVPNKDKYIEALEAETESDAGKKLLSDAQLLMKMSEEATYVDIGLGYKGMGEDFEVSSGMNSALSGINFLGFGVRENGDSRNIAVLMKKLGHIAYRADEEDGSWDPDSVPPEEYPEDWDGKGGVQGAISARASELTRELRTALSFVSEQHINLDGTNKSLQTNLKQLTEKAKTLNAQIVEIEDIDPADAISTMLYAQYCYNAALKIGPEILSQSLIDYMR